ncbi:hypothetical protein PI124_g15121 [Phytophthora idaei]|nr:hypothetical protein PI125_g14989 [Phytophthora idaei]KAG3144680.1 hypothetical protein PI126_g14056 [Phytophthora idaei]KAG3239956.1 hypothetical protein PI124_g15121 [Phytophthora idaei]
MDLAAIKGELSVIKWIHESHGEGCTSMAVEFAVYSGHLRTVWWLVIHYPDLKPGYVELGEDALNKFDAPLLLVWYFGQNIITPEFVKESLMTDDAEPRDVYIAEWLGEKAKQG